MARIEEIRELVFFMRVPDDEQLQEIAKIIHEKSYAARMNIFEKDTTDAKMYIIKSGLVQIVIPKGDTEDVIATFQEGEFFGEMSIFDLAPRSATARAAKETTLYEIAKQDFDQFVEEHPDIAAKLLYTMMEEMVRRLRKTTTPDDIAFF